MQRYPRRKNKQATLFKQVPKKTAAAFCPPETLEPARNELGLASEGAIQGDRPCARIPTCIRAFPQDQGSFSTGPPDTTPRNVNHRGPKTHLVTRARHGDLVHKIRSPVAAGRDKRRSFGDSNSSNKVNKPKTSVFRHDMSSGYKKHGSTPPASPSSSPSSWGSNAQGMKNAQSRYCGQILHKNPKKAVQNLARHTAKRENNRPRPKKQPQKSNLNRAPCRTHPSLSAVNVSM